MMGRLKSDQGQLFYEFHLGEAVPEDHLIRKIDAALDLSWLRSELAPHYSSMGRPSIDPELMIRMLVVGYVFAIRSERLGREYAGLDFDVAFLGLDERRRCAHATAVCGAAAGSAARKQREQGGWRR